LVTDDEKAFSCPANAKYGPVVSATVNTEAVVLAGITVVIVTTKFILWKGILVPAVTVADPELEAVTLTNAEEYVAGNGEVPVTGARFNTWLSSHVATLND
jgi:hypothetical protein